MDETPEPVKAGGKKPQGQSVLGRAWRLVRGERRGPISKFLARRVTLRFGSRRRPAPLGALLALVLVLVVGLASVVVFATPVLGARSVSVVGTKELSEAQIRRAADIPSGKPLARLNTGEVESRVRSIPGIAKAKVTRAWPGTVRVKVKERKPAAIIVRGNEYIVVDSLGVPYKIEKKRPAKLPLITISQSNNVVIPNFSDNPKPKKNKALLAAARTSRALTPELLAKVATVQAPDNRHVSLKLTDGRVFFWGAADDPTENLRKATVATVLLNRPGKTIDVSTPGVVSVR